MSVMQILMTTAQNVIDQHGGNRLAALKEIQRKKAGGNDSDDEDNHKKPRSDSESDSDSDDTSDSESIEESSDDDKPQPKRFADVPHRTSLDELDNILNGILSKSSTDLTKAGAPEPKAQPPPQPAKPAQQAPPPQLPADAEDELEALLSGLQAKAKAKTPVSNSSASAPTSSANSPATPGPTQAVRLAVPTRTPSSSSLTSVTPRTATAMAVTSHSVTSSPVTPRKISDNTVAGQWTVANNGGCTNSPAWRRNLQYLFTVASPTSVRVTVTQSEPFNAIGFYVAKATPDKMKLLVLDKNNIAPGSEVGFQKAKYVTVEFKADAGDYIVIPSTFQTGVEGSYELEVVGMFILRIANLAESQ